jgi:hypothetical protein
MSTPQRTHAAVTLVVDRYTAGVLRLEAKKILMFGHEPFEDFLDLSPEAQCVLAMGFQDAIDLITAVGWDPDSAQAKATSYEVPLTDDLVKDLAHRRVDLAASTTERLNEFREGEPIPADVMTKITANRNAVGALDHLIGAYTVAVAQRQP